MKHFFGLLFLVVFSSVGFAQNLPFNKSVLDKFKNDYPQEKVFLQTDKTHYFSGETIWMKAWCMVDGMPTFLSRILYVDLVNSTGQVILKKMYKLDSLSSTAADFDLSSNIKSGNYSVNAYTLWMLNFPSFVFRKNIFVYGKDYNTAEVKQQKPTLKMSFFPEGGDIIGGLKNRVAFKVYDDKGLPVNVKGNITDNSGKQIVTFETQHDGMGIVESEFASGTEYIANIIASNGSTLQFKLPTVKEEGITLRVENTNPNRLFVLLNRSEKNKEKFSKVKVVAQINYQVVFNNELNFEEGQTAAPISKKNLPPGILHITVFDVNNLPIAERLVFVENYSLEKPKVKLESINLKPRAKNQISFGVDSFKTALSVSITTASLGNDASIDDNISSAFLLTADLKGGVINPGYYFANKEVTTLRHLDLLLMTQGWRRFEWKKIINNEFATLKYPVESGISIRGKLTKSDRDASIKDGHVAFVIKGEDSTRIMADARVTDKGEFLLSDINYKKRATISYQGTNNKKENLIVDVKLESSYIDSLSKSTNTPFLNLDTADLNNRNSAWASFLKGTVQKQDTAFKGRDLGNVTVKAKRLSKEDSLNNIYATGPFVMGNSVVPDDYKNSITVWQMLQQAIPGITVEGNMFDPTVYFNRFRGLNALSDNTSSGTSISNSTGEVSVDIVMQTGGIAYFINEVNVGKDVVNSLSVDDVALIKVLKNEGAMLGASEGVIAFYTKKGIAARSSIFDKAFTNIEREGYAITRQYFSPDYEGDPNLKKFETDKRFTVYWNGNIQPAKDGKYRFIFFNNDIASKLKLIIQGIDKDGQFIYTEQIIQ